jgi:hypothetical protein
MLYLNPNKEKILTFEVELSGASSSEIDGFIRFFISEEVQLGFPVVIGENQIQAVIAPLKNLVKKAIKNGTIFEAQLDLYTEEQDYFSPWKGEIEVKMPVTIEAKIVDEDSKSRLSESNKGGIKVKSVSESDRIKDTKKEQIVEERLSKYRNVKTTNVKPRPKSKQPTIEDLKKHVNEEFIYKYMAKVGTKTKRIQELVYEQAIGAAQSGDQYKVFKEVVKILGKKKPRQKRGD